MLLLGFSLSLFLCSRPGVYVTPRPMLVTTRLQAVPCLPWLQVCLRWLEQLRFYVHRCNRIHIRLRLRCILAFLAWIAGDYVSWLLVHRKLRHLSEARGSNSVAGFLAHDGEQANRGLQIFLDSQSYSLLCTLQRNSKQEERPRNHAQLAICFRHLHWRDFGACLFICRGNLTSIWTDVAQSIVMIGAMALLTLSDPVPLGENWNATPCHRSQLGLAYTRRCIPRPGAVRAWLVHCGRWWGGATTYDCSGHDCEVSERHSCHAPNVFWLVRSFQCVHHVGGFIRTHPPGWPRL